MVVQGGGRLMVSAPLSARSTRHPWVGAHSCQMHRIPDARASRPLTLASGGPDIYTGRTEIGTGRCGFAVDASQSRPSRRRVVAGTSRRVAVASQQTDIANTRPMTLTDTPLTTLLREPDTDRARRASLQRLSASDADVHSDPRAARRAAGRGGRAALAVARSSSRSSPTRPPSPSLFGRALTILDSPRRKRQVEAKLAAPRRRVPASKSRCDEFNALTAEDSTISPRLSGGGEAAAPYPAEREEFDVLFFGPETGNQP